MIKFKVKKLNNDGSTFVLSLLVITLLTTLAFALASASLTNMMMKSVDRTAKKNFYTAESLLDEVRAGVGYDSLEHLSVAYKTVLSSLVNNQGDDIIVKDNTTANEDLKDAYIENALNKITGGRLSFGSGERVYTDSNSVDAKNNAIAYLQAYIQGYASGMAQVTSIGEIQAYKDSDEGYKWAIIIEDVAFSYKEDKGGELLFANITADIEIEYPNMHVDFTATNRITDFINYALIADNSLLIAGQKVNIHASIYAGHLIDIVTGSNRGSEVVISSFTNENINVICGGNIAEENDNGTSGNIRVGGVDGVRSSATFSRANIWCNNILTVKRSHTDDTGAKIVIDNECNTYIRDDFSVEASNSEVVLNGKYYGYMYDGRVDNQPSGHGASSAIIVNGSDSKVSVGASHLMIGGHAYIDIGTNGTNILQYMTGESLSLKGSQEVYLIPSKYLGIGYGGNVQNPTSVEAWNELVNAAAGDASIKICDPSTSFVKDYLVTGLPYEVITTSNGMVYVYWNFKDKESAAKYIKDVVDGKDPDLKEKLTRYNKNLFSSTNGSSVTVSANAEIEATGMFMESVNGLPGYKEPDGVNPDIFTLTSKDLKNRYNILTHLLVSLPWDSGNARYYATDADVALDQLRGIVLENGELGKRDIIENIIAMDILIGNGGDEYNRAAEPIDYGTEVQNYTKVAVIGNFTVPDGTGNTTRIDGGIIVATGSVTLNHNFDGLIIAGGDIIIQGDAKITTNANMVEELINGKEDFKDENVTAENRPFKDYFIAYKSSAVEEDSREEIKIENVNYKDLVSFNNWRKYED